MATQSTTLRGAGLCALVLMLGGASSGAAFAQPVRPNVLVVFDTSGSMGDNDQFGTLPRLDGSPLCNGQGQDRRIYILKEALKQALAQVGTDEVNFGLARFPQVENLNVNECPSGHYVSDDASTDRGCRLSTHGASETTFGTWFTSQAFGKAAFRQSIVVDVTRPFTATPAAGDFDPPGGNITTIAQWLDHQETVQGGVITNPEIRIGPRGNGNTGLPAGTNGGWRTPLGRSLLYSKLYFDQFIKGNDPKASCRQNLVILVTDGVETCDPVSGMGTPPFNLTTCQNTGSPVYPALHPIVQACQMFRQSNVKTYVLTDTTLAANNNLIAQAGGTNAAIGVSLTNADAIKSALVGIIAENVPPGETCNNVDDNCNGDIDNRGGQDGPLPGVGERCLCGALTPEQDGVGICKRGTTVCTNGGITCEGCVPPAMERCNGIDDDCDREIDEGFNVGQACNNGLLGACYRAGTYVCSGNGLGTTCDAPAVQPGEEVCNNVDDDCDGMTDEPATPGGKLPGEGTECGSGLGVCKKGELVCDRTNGSPTKGQFVCTEQNTMGAAEMCNGLDDNCNGQTDEGLGGGNCACLDPADRSKYSTDPAELAKQMVGECKPGTLVCRSDLKAVVCEGCVLTRTETCDGKDNDCDGMTDEGDDICPPARVCIDAKCELKCTSGEFPCPGGYMCVEHPKAPYCKSSLCNDKVCQPGFDCDPQDGECKDLCAGVMCPAPKVCRSGDCVDCRQLGCPAGQLCQTGACVPDLCAGKTCGADEYCDRGVCYGTCPLGCATGQRCVQGQCTVNPCAGISCGGGQVCDPNDGMCKQNVCVLKVCPAGERCIRTTGECKADPCGTVNCGACKRCSLTDDGYPLCERDPVCGEPPPPPDVRTIKTSGGGGCACSTPGGSSGGSALPLFGVIAGALAFVRRRRRRRGW